MLCLTQFVLTLSPRINFKIPKTSQKKKYRRDIFFFLVNLKFSLQNYEKILKRNVSLLLIVASESRRHDSVGIVTSCSGSLCYIMTFISWVSDTWWILKKLITLDIYFNLFIFSNIPFWWQTKRVAEGVNLYNTNITIKPVKIDRYIYRYICHRDITIKPLRLDR